MNLALLGMMSEAEQILHRLSAGETIAARTVLVAAHPDDETLALGARFGQFSDLTLIHLTDGAPLDGADAQRLGFPTRQAYAAARAAELDAVLEAAGAGMAKRLSYGMTDKGCARDLVRLTERLVHDIADAEVVLTHPFEGGHPDHDAAAFAVWAACELLDRDGLSSPLRLEFTSYHQAPEGRVAERFWHDHSVSEVVLALSDEERARKKGLLDLFATQRDVLGVFPVELDRFRPAPTYDFTAVPPPGVALYDGFGWTITQADFRREAARALAALGLEARR